MLTKAGITEWDLLIVGDGSGTGWGDACGWASVLIDRRTRNRKLFYGAMNLGSVNLAEMMPYYQALAWFHNNHGKARLKERSPLLVHVITDSQVTALHGNRITNKHEGLPKVAHRALWAGVQEFIALGYRLEFRWARRDTSGLNNLCDLIAGLSRRAIKDTEPSGVEGSANRMADALGRLTFADPETGRPISPYEINPDGITQ